MRIQTSRGAYFLGGSISVHSHFSMSLLIFMTYVVGNLKVLVNFGCSEATWLRHRKLWSRPGEPTLSFENLPSIGCATVRLWSSHLFHGTLTVAHPNMHNLHICETPPFGCRCDDEKAERIHFGLTGWHMHPLPYSLSVVNTYPIARHQKIKNAVGQFHISN